MRLPSLFRRNGHASNSPAMKNRLLKNREAVLGIMSDNIQGAKSCPFLLGEKCIGAMCEFFSEYKTTNLEAGTEQIYSRCDHKQVPILLMELNRNIVTLTQIMQKADA